MPKKMLRLRFSILIPLVSAFIPTETASQEWQPFPLLRRDEPTIGMASSGGRVVAASARQLYEFGHQAGAWTRIGKETLSSPFTSIFATSSRIYIPEVGMQVWDSAEATPKNLDPYPTNLCCRISAAAEDSARYFLRAARDRVVVSDKGDPGWSPLYPLPETSEGLRIVLPFTGHIVASSTRGIFLSQDRGRSWVEVETIPRDPVHLLKRFGDALYAAMSNQGIYRSGDQGRNWSALFPTDSPHANLWISDVAANGDTLWLATDYETSRGVLRSVDAGRTWEWMNSGLPASPFPGQNAGAPAQHYPTKGLARSGGALWVHALKNIPESASSYRVENAMYTSMDGGANWTAADTGLPASGAYWLVQAGSGMKVLVQKLVDHAAVGIQVYGFQADLRKWMLDPAYPDPIDSWLWAQGEYEFIQQGRDLLRKTAGKEAWEKVSLPWWEDDTSAYMPRTVTSIFIHGREIFLNAYTSGPVVGDGPVFHHSDDFGKTWARERPFLPQAKFQGRLVEGRGNQLCWPDDTLYTPPLAWREFPSEIRNLWLMGNRLAVQAGSRLYFSEVSGEGWQEQALPDTGLFLALREGILSGYTPDTVWTLAGPGVPWRSRAVRFPLPEVLDLAAGPEAVWARHSNWLDYRLRSMGTSGSINGYSYLSLPIADGGDYLMLGYGSVMDTLSIPFLPIRRESRVQVPNSGKGLTALYGYGDFMAEARGNGEIHISSNRGKSWSRAGNLPDSVSDLTGSTDGLVALCKGSAFFSRDSGKTWSALPAQSLSFTNVAGTAGRLAALAKDGRILVSLDTGRSWSPLPSLPAGTGAGPTSLASWGGQVLAGTEEHGVFAWGDAVVGVSRQPGTAAIGKSTAPFPRGWTYVPGQGWLYAIAPGLKVDARGRRGLSKESNVPSRGR